MTQDIEKAFLQIRVDRDHGDYLRFLWFDDVFSEAPTIVRNRFARVVVKGLIHKKFQSASTRRAQPSVAAKVVRPTDLLNHVKT